MRLMLKQNFCYDFNGRFGTSCLVTLYFTYKFKFIIRPYSEPIGKIVTGYKKSVNLSRWSSATDVGVQLAEEALAFEVGL